MTVAAGEVYDRGYRPYEGRRGGRRSAVAALYRSTLRRALGIRRTWWHKLMPWLLLGIVTLPAAVNVGLAYVTRDLATGPVQIITYRTYVGVSSALLLFVALVAPDAVCPDRRQRVLPLIFSRPITGRDYALAKLGVIATLVGAFSLLPQVLLFIGQMLVGREGALGYLSGHLGVLWQVPAAVVLLAVYYAALALAVSSLTSRRVVAAATILGLVWVTSSVSRVLELAPGVTPAVTVLNLLRLPLYARDLIFLGRIGGDFRLSELAGGGALALGAYAAVVAGSIAVLLWRYRWVER